MPRDSKSGDVEAPPASEVSAVAGTGEAVGGSSKANERTPLIKAYADKPIYSAQVLETPIPSIDRWLKREKNPDFADSIEMALRVAITIILFRTPELFGFSFLSRFDSNLVQVLRRYELLSPEVIVMLIYMLYKTVGETIYFVWTSYLGVIIGSAWPWFMFAVYEDGVLPEHSRVGPEFVFGMIAGQGFIIMILLLNFDINTKIFAGSTFVWHWMSFMHPHTGREYHMGGYAMDMGLLGKGLIESFSGCVIAILISLVPYPMTAVRRARISADAIVTATGTTWASVISFYSASFADVSLLGELQHNHQFLAKLINPLRGHIDNAWWEEFGSTTIPRSRAMLSEFDSLMHETFESLTSIVMAHSTEEWNAQHQIFMATVEAQLQDVCTKSTSLLSRVVDLACQGRPSEVVAETQPKVEADIEDLKQSILLLATQNRSCRLSTNEGERFEESLLGEHSLCLAVTAYGRVAIAFADYAYNPSFDEMLVPRRPFLERFKSYCSGLFKSSVVLERYNINFAVRNSLTIFLCFMIGMKGYSQMLPSYSATSASTAAILISKYQGSSMTLNMARLQGVTVGLLLGQLGYATIGWCEMWAGFVRQFVSMIYLTVNLYMYYSGSKSGSFCLYAAAFGSRYFLSECSSAVQRPQDLVYSIVELVLCLVVLTSVDLAFTIQTPSKSAHGAALDIWTVIKEASTEVCSKVSLKVPVHNTLLSKVQTAKFLNLEAEGEIRAWREPWKSNLFSAVIKWSTCMSANLALIAQTARNVGDDCLEKDRLRTRLKNLPEFKKLADALRSTIDRVPDMLQALRMGRNKWKFAYGNQMTVDLEKAVEDGVLSVLQAANRSSEFHESDAETMLDEDDIARLSAVLSAINSMALCMRQLREGVITG